MLSVEQVPGTGVIDPVDEAVEIEWLGQAGFLLRHRGLVVAIDPYLSDSLAVKYAGKLFPHRRMVPPPVAPEDLGDVAAVLCTHSHTDHMDPLTIGAIRASNDPMFVVPRAVADVALQRGVPAARMMRLNATETVAPAVGLTVTAVPAAHETLKVNDHGEHLFLGYVITIGGVRIYHSGDCVPYSGQADLLRDHQLDLALLPVNGRDEYRRNNGVPGNFSAGEAMELCEQADIPWMIPHHIGLFEFNTVEPEVVAEELTKRARTVRWLLPEIGGRYRLHRQDTAEYVLPALGCEN